jgi:anti-sigma B factor antagonist
MKTETRGDTLVVSGVHNLGADQAPYLRELVGSALLPEQRCIEVDLADTTFIDSEGLGALVSVHKLVASRGGIVRLPGARPAIRELFRLTRLDRIFEFSTPS